MTLAIIGAGPAGLVSAKTALDCGLQPTVLEKSQSIGGLWKPGNGSVWDNMTTNISHYTSAFSDFPWENPSQDFPSQKEVYSYLLSYAEKKSLLPYLHLEAEAKRVSRHGDKWKVEWLEKGVSVAEEFDYLIISTGIFSKAYIPAIQGQHTFPGTVIHSQNYKTVEPYRDKIVAIIGNSLSGTEIAAEIATVATRVVNIASKAMWVLPRYLPKGDRKLPLDLVFYSRASAVATLNSTVAANNIRKNNWFKAITKQEEIDQGLAVTTPASDPAYVAISDSYLELVKNAKIELKRSRVKEISVQTLSFEDGSSLPVDAISAAALRQPRKKQWRQRSQKSVRSDIRCQNRNFLMVTM